MGIDSFQPKTLKLMELHIKVLERIFLLEPFDQIYQVLQKNIDELNYIEIIKESGHLSFTNNIDLIGAYPVSPSPSDYNIDLEDIGHGYSMCAVDALGLPFTFMRKAMITTIDKSTGNKLHLTIDPKSNQQEVYDLLVTYQKSPVEFQGNKSAAKVQCPNINFYSIRNNIPEHLQIWEYTEALKYARKRFGQTEMLQRIQNAITKLSI